jgi:4-amino-4-deoxy-L-arabinose transferase-like glycosyltransferase
MTERKSEDDGETPEAADADTEADAEAKADAGVEADAEAKAVAEDASKRERDGGDEAAAVAAEPPNAKDDTAKLLPRGNPLRRKRGGIVLAVGAIGALALMAHDGQLRWGVPLGFLFVAVAAFGLMDLVGSFDDDARTVVHETTLANLRGPLLSTLGAALATCAALMGAQSGLGSPWLWAAVVPGAFLALVASTYELGARLGPWAEDETGAPRPLLKRHGFWLVTAATVLYLPALGSYSLWDPWETHYGEVAREILAKDDWISLWWAQDGWFWSKPILNFWIQAIAMASLGTHYQPDKMLMGVNGAMAHPEWVVRFPNFLLTLFGTYLIYKGVAKVFGRRAGLFGGLVLLTMPDWYFLAHQTMTDMPFVGPMTATMGLLLLGLHTDEAQEVRRYEVRVGSMVLRLSGWHLAFAAILLCAIPQILYLLSRNLELVLHGDGPHGLRPHWDEFRSGSGGGNCGLPGNEACRTVSPAAVPRAAGPNPATFGLQMLRLFAGFEPVIQAILWGALLGALLYVNWGERRLRRIYYLAAWFFAALATMGKGPAGFALPILCAFAYVGTKRRWAELLKIEMLSGLLIILTVAIPWYVAMYVRHGSPFTDRLIFHDMFNRAFSHVHDTNEGDDTSFRFYVWQLGYALFPWTGLAPLGLTWWLRRGDSADRGRADVSVFLAMWFIFAFALFSFMGTKFHHYIFPAVPPVAMLVGIVLDDFVGAQPITRRMHPLAWGASLAGLGGSVVLGITRWTGQSLTGDGEFGRIDGVALGVCLVLFVVPIALRRAGVLPEPAAPIVPRKTKVMALAHRDAPPRAEPEGTQEHDPRAAHEALMLGAAAVGAALVLVLVGRDLAIKAPTPGEQPGAIRLLHLFTYNYRRPWPEHLDFSGVLLGFAVVAVLVSLLLCARSIRRHAVVAMLGLGLVAAVWGLDAYMVQTAPHWGQHEVIEAYYRDRKSPDEPIVAYQMNWKGENFYTGNRIPAFVSSGTPFTTWVRQQRDKGVRVMYFVTEHGRTSGLRSEVGAKSYREITDKKLCNKFVLVRAEL